MVWDWGYGGLAALATGNYLTTFGSPVFGMLFDNRADPVEGPEVVMFKIGCYCDWFLFWDSIDLKSLNNKN